MLEHLSIIRLPDDILQEMRLMHEMLDRKFNFTVFLNITYKEGKMPRQNISGQ